MEAASMPVRVNFLLGTQTLTVEQAYGWIRDAAPGLARDPTTVQTLRVFLANWDRAYGFLQQTEFLRHFQMYVDQIELLNGIGDLCDKIITDYPPDEYLYVGIGRSPAPLIAYFQNRRLETLTIPLSDFRPRNETWSLTDDVLVERTGWGVVQGRPRLSGPRRVALFTHFSNYFPARPSRDRILVIDYTQSALSLVAAQEQLQRFFSEGLELPFIQVHALAICRDSDESTARAVGTTIGTPRSPFFHPIDWYYYTDQRETFAQRWHVLPVGQLGRATPRQQLVMAALGGERFDPMAEYGPFKVLRVDARLIRYTGDRQATAAYDALREELRNATLP
jgi:hypothetical protein